jgi:hypothetical protein
MLTQCVVCCADNRNKSSGGWKLLQVGCTPWTTAWVAPAAAVLPQTVLLIKQAAPV